jgi:outer membrane protein TolC
MNRPIDGFGTGVQMTMNSVQLSQRFPWPGKLGFAEERARRLSEAERFSASEVELQLLARVKSVYFQTAYVDRAILIMEDTRELLRGFLDVSSTRYAVGEGLQQDVLQAQVAVAQMTEDITVMRQNRLALSARLNALLGREASIPIGPLELGEELPAIGSVDSLIQRAVAARPALRAAQERTRAAAAGYRAARRAVYPDFTVTLGYGERPQFVDLATVMVGVTIPLWAGARQLPLRREMAAIKSMEEARERDLYNETLASIAELHAEAQRARNLLALYADAILPQAQASVESALSAYRVGRVDYLTLIQNELTVNRYEIETVRLRSEYHRAKAELEALAGFPYGDGA